MVDEYVDELQAQNAGTNDQTQETVQRETVLEIQNLKKYFPVKGLLGRTKQNVKAVEDVSFTLQKGETLGLVGESGCGKSTLGRTILRLTEPTEGRILLHGEDITKLSEKELRPYRRKMQMVFQDPYSALDPRVRIGHALEEILEIQGIDLGGKAGREAYCKEILKRVGLKEEMYLRFPHEFSGGQRQRIVIAKALILEPELLICDEPVSALDVSVQAQIMNLLRDIKKTQGISCIFISHDISVVRYISDRIAVMYLGHIVEVGETDEIIRNPKHPYTQSLLSAVPTLDTNRDKKRTILTGDVPSPLNPPSGCPFHTRCPHCTDACKEALPQLQGTASHLVRCRGDGSFVTRSAPLA